MALWGNLYCSHHDHPLVSLMKILPVRDAPLHLASALRVRAGDVTPPLHQHVTEREHERAQRLVVGHVSAFNFTLEVQTLRQKRDIFDDELQSV